ncbi:unnamed protein product [Closterium sp. Naga37s-1]|nr:unnamed protein product [Closterium sp. Naga37s-1]
MVPATNRGNVEEEEEEAADAAAGLVSEEALDSATNEAAQERMLGITTPAVAAATVTIASAPSSPILELNVIETFLLGEMPQQQQQPERVFNASSSIQGESVWAPDQDVACATGVNTCATPAGQPGIDNYQCCSVNWDGTAVLSPLADSFPPAPGAGAAQELLPPAAVPPDVVDLVFENSQKPAGAAQEPLPPAAVPSDMVEPGSMPSTVSMSAPSLLSSQLTHPNPSNFRANPLQVATPTATAQEPMLSTVSMPAPSLLSSQLTHPNPSNFHAKPLQVATPTATAQAPMPSTVSMSTPSLLSSQLTHPDHSNYHANPLQVATPTATAQAPMTSTVSMSAPSLLSSQLTHPNPSNFHANPLQVATPTATAQAPMPSTVSMSTPSLLSPVPSYAAATPPSIDPFATSPSVAAAPPAVTPAPASAVAVYSLGCIPFPQPRGREAVSREAVAVDFLGCIFLPEPRGSEAVSMEGCLKPDELFEAWCNGSFTRVLHGF